MAKADMTFDAAAYRAAHREELREAERVRRRRDPERARAMDRATRLRNLDKKLAMGAAYRAAHREELAAKCAQNLRPACPPCNQRKHKRTLEELAA